MSTSQRAVTLCAWGVKPGMVRVWVAGKTVWSPCYHEPYLSALEMRFMIKRYTNRYFTYLLYLLTHVSARMRRGSPGWKSIFTNEDSLQSKCKKAKDERLLFSSGNAKTSFVDCNPWGLENGRPQWGSGCSSGRWSEAKDPQKLKQFALQILQTLFTDFDCTNDQNFKLWY